PRRAAAAEFVGRADQGRSGKDGGIPVAAALPRRRVFRHALLAQLPRRRPPRRPRRALVERLSPLASSSAITPPRHGKPCPSPSLLPLPRSRARHHRRGAGL